MNEFDVKAVEWDKNPANIERAKAIAMVIRKELRGRAGGKAFEYGCGTGLLSFILMDEFEAVTMADSSKGMLEALETKIKSGNIAKMRSILLNLEIENPPDGRYDVIYTQMTFHHIIEIEEVLRKFYIMLEYGGILFIADLYPEDGSFHGNGFTGHKGFDPEKLKILLEKADFTSVRYRESFRMSKTIGNKEKIFPIFLITAEKKL